MLRPKQIDRREFEAFRELAQMIRVRERSYGSRTHDAGYDSALARACPREPECDERCAERRSTMQPSPAAFADLVRCLRAHQSVSLTDIDSHFAEKHDVLRHKQGYRAAMMVEESRMLQISIFETLRENLPNLDSAVLLKGVMAIADEVDSQLSQAVVCFDAE